MEFIYINLGFFISRDVFLEQRGATPIEQGSPKKGVILQNLDELFRAHFSPIHGAVDGWEHSKEEDQGLSLSLLSFSTALLSFSTAMSFDSLLMFIP